jgi:methylenetetrahydrofolate reductase (NADPH)
VPIKVGVAGPADRKLLFRYAMVCGVGNSIRALGAHGEQVGGLMTRESPDAVLKGVAAAQAARPELGVAGVHVFTFGGIANTAKWAKELSGRG